MHLQHTGPQYLNAPIFQKILAADADSQATFGHCTELFIEFGQRGTEVPSVTLYPLLHLSVYVQE